MDLLAPEPPAEDSPPHPGAPLGRPSWPAERSWIWKTVQWPLCRIVLALVGVLATQVAVQRSLYRLWPAARAGAGLTGGLERGAVLLLALLSMHLVYRLYVRFIEWRRAGELSLAGAGREAGIGAAIGGGMMAVSVGVLWLAGFYHVAGARSAVSMLPALDISLFSGYAEELVVRVIFFRILEESIGTGWALAVSGGLFGWLHWFNPHATLVSVLSIALAGVLLGAAFAVTRRIWLAAGLHFGWNFAQGGIFGVAISGTSAQGWLAGSLSGPEVLSGGAFGVEGSLLSVLVCAAAAALLLRAAARRRHLVPPFWRRAALGAPPPAPAVTG